MDHEMVVGREVRAELMNWIRAADALVVIMSSRSLKSIWVNQEVAFARGAGTPVVPIYDDFDGSRAPSRDFDGMLAGHNWLEHSEWDSPEFRAILLKHLTEAARTKVRPPVVISDRSQRAARLTTLLEQACDRDEPPQIYLQAALSTLALGPVEEYRNAC